MKALVYDGVETINYRDVADPEVPSGEHLIRIDAVGICGSDMHAYLGHDLRRPAPLILGHEAAGTILEGPRKDERVTINPLVCCRVCQACQAGRENLCPERQIISMPPREGAFAEMVCMPGRNLISVPDDVPLAKAALTEPLAVSWHTVRLAINALPKDMDQTALVIGGGAIGLAAALALKAQGISDITVTEPNARRLEFLTHHCNVHAVPDTAEPFPLVIDAVGYAATRTKASLLAMPGGVIGHVGLGDDNGGLDIRRMTLQEITFIGTYTYTAQDFRDTAQAIFDGTLGPLDWIEHRALSDGANAFRELRNGAVAAPKIILDPSA